MLKEELEVVYLLHEIEQVGEGLFVVFFEQVPGEEKLVARRLLTLGGEAMGKVGSPLLRPV